jgi:hypothetical protein
VLGITLPLASAGLAPPPSDRVTSEPLLAALAAGRVQTDDLIGREVFAFDETRLGTLTTITGPLGRSGAVTALVVLDTRLGFGRGCIAAPLTLMLEAPERRLVLVFSPEELRAAAEARPPCGA